MIDFSVMAEAILKRILFVEQPKALIAKKELNNYMDDILKKMNEAGTLIAISTAGVLSPSSLAIST